MSPDWMVRFHVGYAIDECDYRDVKALCERFGIELPAEYLPFEQVAGASIQAGWHHDPGNVGPVAAEPGQ
jgi:hypothetical protein